MTTTPTIRLATLALSALSALGAADFSLTAGTAAPLSEMQVRGTSNQTLAYHADAAIGWSVGVGLSWRQEEAYDSFQVQHSLLRADDLPASDQPMMRLAMTGWRFDLGLTGQRHAGSLQTRDVGDQGEAYTGALFLDALAVETQVGLGLRFANGSAAFLPRTMLVDVGLVGAGGVARAGLAGRWSDPGPYARYGARLTVSAPISKQWTLGLAGGWEIVSASPRWPGTQQVQVDGSGAVFALTISTRLGN